MRFVNGVLKNRQQMCATDLPQYKKNTHLCHTSDCKGFSV